MALQIFKELGVLDAVANFNYGKKQLVPMNTDFC